MNTENLEQLIEQNKIQKIVEFIDRSSERAELCEWLCEYMDKAEDMFVRNTSAIALGDLGYEPAIPVIARLAAESKFGDGSLVYALSLFDCRKELDTVFPLIYQGNYECRREVLELLERYLPELSADEKHNYEERLQRMLEDCEDKREGLKHALELFETE